MRVPVKREHSMYFERTSRAIEDSPGQWSSSYNPTPRLDFVMAICDHIWKYAKEKLAPAS